MVEESPSVREREHIEEEEEEEEEKSPKSHVAMAWIWTHNVSPLSRALYPLDHGALPKAIKLDSS